MDILILGAGGQLGTEWKGFLKESGSHIRYSAFGSRDLDITDRDKVEQTLHRACPDIIINCAAYTNVDKAEDETQKAKELNTDAVGSLAALCFDLGVKLVHYSTDYVFPGRKQDQVDLPDGYPEDYPADPINVYGQTKWEGEEAIRSSGCSHLIIRTSWLCGQFGSNFVKTMLRLSLERASLDVVADQWGSPSYTDNIVSNTLALIEEEADGTYHLTSEGLITWADFAESIFRIAGTGTNVKRVTSEAFPVRARRPSFSKLDTTRARQVPGIHVEDWESGLKRLIQKLENR